MCVTLDSAYSGDTLFQIARDIWGLNMVGTCQVNRSGVFPHAVKDKSSLKVGSYDSILYQHRTLNLCYAMCYAMWADNNIVKSFSNFHTPEILEAGTGVHFPSRSTVPIPAKALQFYVLPSI